MNSTRPHIRFCQFTLIFIFGVASRVLAQGDSVTVSAAEFQRMVYSAHLLTEMQAKPELEPGMKALLELHRRNPQADPVALAGLVRQALQRYRTNTPAGVRLNGYRDEISAAFYAALCQVPARTNFVAATLQLLNPFMIQPDDYTNAPATELIHSGNQRLQATAGVLEQRRSLLDACAARAGANAAFAGALDAFLAPETLVSVHDSPATIIGDTNSALHGNPTFQLLLSLSAANINGNLTVSSNQLLNLFDSEIRTHWTLIQTNLALLREFNQSQPDFVAYLNNPAAVDAWRLHQTEVQQDQPRKLAVATAAVLVQSELLKAPDPLLPLPDHMQNCVEGLHMITDGLAAFSDQDVSRIGKIAASGNMLSGGLKLFDMFFGGESIEDQTVRELGNVKTLIGDLSTNMNYRFDRVDESLTTIFETMNEQFSKIEINQNQNFAMLNGSLSDIRSTLVNVQSDLHRLERHLFSYVKELDNRHLSENLNLYLGFEAKYGTPMSYNGPMVPWYVTGDNTFFTYAMGANTPLSSPWEGRDYTPLGVLNELTESSGTIVSNRLDENLSYIKNYLGTRLNQTTAGPLPLANPRDWFVGAYANLQLAVENPSYFRRVTPALGIDLLPVRAYELTNFLTSLTFNGANINWSLQDALRTNYSGRVNSFINQIRNTEQQYAAATNFALDGWRNWSTSAPRVTATSTEVRASNPNVPLAGFPNPVRKLAGAAQHGFALRADGSLVGWGRDYYGETVVPPGATNLIDVGVGTWFSVALRGDGTVIGWGQITVPPDATNITAIAVGDDHVLALRADRTVLAWGGNSYHQIEVPDGLTNVMAVSASYSHSLALLADGSIVGWGDNRYGQLTPPPTATNVMQMVAGKGFSMVLRRDGTLVGWGNNDHYQLDIPPAATDVIAIATGKDDHCIALKANGTVLSWGNWYEDQSSTPAGLSNVIAVFGGSYCSFAVKADGSIVQWGRLQALPSLITWQGAFSSGFSGRCIALRPDGTVVAWDNDIFGHGIGSWSGTNAISVAMGLTHALVLRFDGTITGWYFGNDYRQATPPAGLSNVVALAAGYQHSAVLRSDGTVVGLGRNNYGQTNVPAGLSKVVAISAGDNHSLALRSDGTVVAWGNNTAGQTNVPADLNGVVAISAGGYCSMALRYDGTVVEWGDNYYGQTNVPPGLNNIVAIAAGSDHSLALRNDGTIASWGYQYGIPSFAGSADVAFVTPEAMIRNDGSVAPVDDFGQTAVPALASRPVQISAGLGHSLVRQENGSVAAFGLNQYGQCNIPADLTNAVAVAAGGLHSVALRANGTVAAWGMNDVFYKWPATVPAGLNNVVAISAGRYHSLALRANGTVAFWGNFDPFQWASTNLPAGLANVVAIASGYDHCLALRADGTVVAWGSNNAGATNVPATAIHIVAIAAGDMSSLALRDDGQVIAWGWNSVGQADVPPEAKSDVVAISAGQGHNLALKRDGTVVSWGGQGIARFTVPAGLTNVVGISAGGWHSLFLCASTNSGTPRLWSLAKIPSPVVGRLVEATTRVRNNLSMAGIMRDTATELSGAKALWQAVLELGLPYTLQRDEVLHGLLYGSESLADLESVENLLSNDINNLTTVPDARPLILTDLASARMTCFTNRLRDRLNDLQAGGQPEIPRLISHTLRLCGILRDSWNTTPPSALEIERGSNTIGIILYGEPYAHHVLQYSDTLMASMWSTIISTNLHNEQRFTVPMAASPQRFYRAVLSGMP